MGLLCVNGAWTRAIWCYDLVVNGGSVLYVHYNVEKRDIFHLGQTQYSVYARDIYIFHFILISKAPKGDVSP